MKCCNWEEKIKKMDGIDIKLIKLSSMAAGLVVFKAVKVVWDWDAFSISIWWWVAIMAVLAIRPCVRICKK